MSKSTLLQRHEIPEELTWDLSTVYASSEDWEKDFELVKSLIPTVAPYKGKVGKSGKNLQAVLELTDRISQLIKKLYVYAHLKNDEDARVDAYQGMFMRIRNLAQECGSATSFIRPEILSINPKRLRNLVAHIKGLKVYAFMLENMQRKKPHVRSKEVEEVMAQVGEWAATPSNVYSLFTNANLRFPDVKDENGKEARLTSGTYGPVFLYNKDREVRKNAFETMMGTLKSFQDTFAAMYAAKVKANVTTARLRNYPSAREMALSNADIPVSVYDELIDTVHKNLPVLHRYLELRRKILGVDKLHMYDLYVPLVGEVDYKVDFEQAKKTVLEACKPLGKDYVEALEQGFRSRWVDVMPNEGKRSGAYSSGTYGTAPFILLNFHSTLNDMFTLTHEAGHSMHSFLTRRTQPYQYADYTIFVAEVASTCNENLLTHHLLQTTEDKALRRYILNNELESIRATLYRQTLFAEFERDAHALAEQGKALTPAVLNGLFKQLNEKYYGAAVEVDELIEAEWMRIPHFYSSFYVYQYATGISAAIALADQILTEGEPAVKRYLNFLSSGSSKYSIDLLKDAGVDLSTPQPIQQALDAFERYLDEFEKLG